MDLTSTELTVLGLLAEQPRHGYELEQVIEERGIRSWTDIGFSSIYYILGRLRDRGFVRPVGEEGGARARRVYEATPEGRREATRAVLATIQSSTGSPQPVLVGLANLDLISDAAYHQALRTRRADIDARILAIEAAQGTASELPTAAQEVFSFSIDMLQAERAWIVRRLEVPA